MGSCGLVVYKKGPSVVSTACTHCLPVADPATPTPPTLSEATGTNLSTDVVGERASI